jgi:hypothetical protein
MRICAIDPGGTTGVAVFVDGTFHRGFELKNLPDVVTWLATWHQEIDVIVLEDFIGSNPGVDYYHPCRIIGAVETCAFQYNLTVIKQTPNCQERFRRYVMGRQISTSPHIRSAACHALFYAKDQGLI